MADHVAGRRRHTVSHWGIRVMTVIDNGIGASYESNARTNFRPILQNRRLLAALAGHELREPLQAIQSFLSVVLDGRTGPLTDQQLDFLSTANQAAKRLSQRIADVQLALTYEDNPFQMDREPVNLRDSAQRCCQELTLLARCHDVTLQLDLSGWEDERLICGDPDRVDQVLLNLIENGIRYARPASIVQVAVRESDSGGCAVVVRNEVETPPKEDPNIWFEPFERGANNANKELCGFGLGLTVVAYLMEAHRGSVSAHVNDHVVSVGATFPSMPRSTQNPDRTKRSALYETIVAVEGPGAHTNGNGRRGE